MMSQVAIQYGSDTKRCSDARVRVLARVRPLFGTEHMQKPMCVSLLGSHAVEVKSTGTRSGRNDQDSSRVHQFSFDAAFGPEVSQEQIFEALDPPNLIAGVLSGKNSMILAYGQTGAGKSYTIEGSPVEACSNAGIVPRFVAALFQTISAISIDRRPRVHISACQIYNECVFDLLSKKPRESLRVRWNPGADFFVQDLTTKRVNLASEALKLVRQCSRNRVTSAGKINLKSSRSHSILKISISYAGKGALSLPSSVTFVDLAGSERFTPGQEDSTLKETIGINHSLLVLRQVLNALASRSRRHVPYRDSLLTRLLHPSLKGDSSCSLIACLSGAQSAVKESMRTLSFVSRARTIRIFETLSMMSTPRESTAASKQKEIGMLQKELQRMKKEMMQLPNAQERISELNRMLEQVVDDRDELKVKNDLLRKRNSDLQLQIQTMCYELRVFQEADVRPETPIIEEFEDCYEDDGFTPGRLREATVDGEYDCNQSLKSPSGEVDELRLSRNLDNMEGNGKLLALDSRENKLDSGDTQTIYSLDSSRYEMPPLFPSKTTGESNIAANYRTNVLDENPLLLSRSGFRKLLPKDRRRGSFGKSISAPFKKVLPRNFKKLQAKSRRLDNTQFIW